MTHAWFEPNCYQKSKKMKYGNICCQKWRWSQTTVWYNLSIMYNRFLKPCPANLLQTFFSAPALRSVYWWRQANIMGKFVSKEDRWLRILTARMEFNALRERVNIFSYIRLSAVHLELLWLPQQTLIKKVIYWSSLDHPVINSELYTWYCIHDTQMVVTAV